MSLDLDLFDALEVFSSPITIHPKLNVLDGGKVDRFRQTVPITHKDLEDDSEAVNTEEPVVPRSSNFSNKIAQSVGGGSNTPRQLAWYSQHKLRLGTLVEYQGVTYQIDEIADYNTVAGLFVYYLKGDDSLEPSV